MDAVDTNSTRGSLRPLVERATERRSDAFGRIVPSPGTARGPRSLRRGVPRRDRTDFPRSTGRGAPNLNALNERLGERYRYNAQDASNGRRSKEGPEIPGTLGLH